jgi:uncharacterized protein YecE (DUF72 family)
MSGTIRTGIGGWTYPPWRGTFYPQGLRQADELRYATAHLGTIEINATFYSLQKPASFAAWSKAAPDGFKFAIKASRFCTNRKVLADAGEAVAKFFNQGIEELGDKLGPIAWQFAATKRFDAEDFAAFLELLPRQVGGLPLRHALEVRHESFACAEFVDLARRYGAAIVCADHEQYPQIADLTADFTYARLMRAQEQLPDGYPAEELANWAEVARAWSEGHAPDGLHYATELGQSADPREVFVYFINGAKERAPAAATALAKLL